MNRKPSATQSSKTVPLALTLDKIANSSKLREIENGRRNVKLKSDMVIHISAVSGHQLSYQNTFVRLLNGQASTGKIGGAIFWRLVKSSNVLFCTIDDDYLGFFCVSILRSLQGKQTAGLFLRPLQCFKKERRIMYPMKKLVFMLLRRLRKLRILSIIPYYLHPKLCEVSHDWIDDPQLWDLWLDGKPVLLDTDLSRLAEKQRRQRKILIYIGSGNRLKNFEKFVEYVEQNQGGILAVVAGRVVPEYRHLIARLEAQGAIIEDRYVTDNEILSLYKIADLAWCRYSQDYDQASGVFGRAMQVGVEPLVRTGSMLEKQLGNQHFSPDLLIARTLNVLVQRQ